MFCPECGYKIDEVGACFCPECGTKIEEFEQQIAEDKMAVDSKDGMYAYGIIFTNVQLLAHKLNAEEHDVRLLLENFIRAKETFGVSYQLVDVGNYTYRKRNFI